MTETGIAFKAYTAASPSKKWDGKIIPIKLDSEPYEAEITARDSSFHVLIGHHIYGQYLCIPNWNVASELATLEDVFWNREQLVNYTKLNKTDASSVACGIAALAKYYDI
jgi:hypothetical protein